MATMPSGRRCGQAQAAWLAHPHHSTAGHRPREHAPTRPPARPHGTYCSRPAPALLHPLF